MAFIFYFLYALWTIASLCLFIYVIQELILLRAAFRTSKLPTVSPLQELPMVTVQLPLYNEKYVAARLIDAICAMDYPRELLDIQVLDDSGDDTVDIVAAKVAAYRQQGFHIAHLRRGERTGFKAGALHYGMATARGNFIAIFDADFLPAKDFLQRSLPYFEDAGVGVVQSRWGHINQEYSILTRAASVMLNMHFFLEQAGRYNSRAFINFNGTAGIWRRSCMEDAGGWHTDTLTEDLDLSYRAQIKHWKFIYLYNLVSPAELPVTLDAYKTQQFRWSKGAAECVRKNMRALWQSDAKLSTKLFGSFHLLNSSVYFIVLLLILVTPILLWLESFTGLPMPLAQPFYVMNMVVMICIPLVFWITNAVVQGGGWWRQLRYLAAVYFLLCMSMGISLYMVKGILEGYRGKVSGFIRTPKYNVSGSTRLRVATAYFSKKDGDLFWAETLLFLLGFVVIYIGIDLRMPYILNYGIMIGIGFGCKLLLPHYDFRNIFSRQRFRQQPADKHTLRR